MIIEPIIWRRAVREYSKEPVLEESVVDVVKAGQFAPTAHNLRLVEFIVVREQAVKNGLFGILEQEFIKKAPVIIVPVCDAKKAPLCRADIAVATAFMMIQAAALGLGTVWKDVNEDQSKKAAKILGLPKNHILINMMPLGYPLNDLPDHTDAEFDPKKIHLENF